MKVNLAVHTQSMRSNLICIVNYIFDFTNLHPRTWVNREANQQLLPLRSVVCNQLSGLHWALCEKNLGNINMLWVLWESMEVCMNMVNM